LAGIVRKRDSGVVPSEEWSEEKLPEISEEVDPCPGLSCLTGASSSLATLTCCAALTWNASPADMETALTCCAAASSSFVASSASASEIRFCSKKASTAKLTSAAKLPAASGATPAAALAASHTGRLASTQGCGATGSSIDGTGGATKLRNNCAIDCAAGVSGAANTNGSSIAARKPEDAALDGGPGGRERESPNADTASGR